VSAESPSRREWTGTVALTLALFAFYAVYSISRWTTYLASGYDLGIFDQAVRAYSHFKAPVVALKGPGYNVLGDHFHPIIAVIAPLYWIWDSPVVLLVVQAALIAASVPVVYRFTRRRTAPGVAFVISAAYGVGWAIQSMIDFDFHEIAFAVPILALAVDALDRRADRAFLGWSLLLLLVREDMGLLLVVLGVLRALVPSGGRRTWRTAAPGLALIVLGVIGYELVTAVVIPHFAPGRRFAYWQYTELGSDLPHALGNMIVHPLRAIRLFFSPSDKSISLAYLLVPFLLLPLRSRYAWLALPLLAERYYNSRPELWTTHYHYSVLPWLLFTLAMVDGADRLGVFRVRWRSQLLVAWLVIVPIWLTAFGQTAPSDLRRMITGAAWRTNAHTAAQRAVVRAIPADTCVAVDDRLAPHLDAHNYTALADFGFVRADFVALDLLYDSVGGNGGPPPRSILAAAEADGYRVVLTQNTLTLLQSPTYAGPSPACHPTARGPAPRGDFGSIRPG
jgi:uncharacterized membrane protein